jgi:uncharacterized DUF497 family protein
MAQANQQLLARDGVLAAMCSGDVFKRVHQRGATRCDYGERRMIGYAYIGLRLYCVVFADREDVRRVIGLRKANSREAKRYAEA